MSVKLSMDARVILTAWFPEPDIWVTIGGPNAKYTLSDRAKASVDELVSTGVIAQLPMFKRTVYVAGYHVRDHLLSLDEVKLHGDWSATAMIKPFAHAHAALTIARQVILKNADKAKFSAAFKQAKIDKELTDGIRAALMYSTGREPQSE